MSAQFPTQMPVLFDDKSTANDVSDSAHWDGADANALKDELLAVAAKVGADGDESETSLDHRVATLEARPAAAFGYGTLAASTSTVVTDARVTATTTVLLQAVSAEFVARAAWLSDVDEGSFTLAHSSATGGESFLYILFN